MVGQTIVTGSNPHDDNKVFYNLVALIMYWTLNSIYMQFECQYPKSSYVSVEHNQLSRGKLNGRDKQETVISSRGVLE